MAIDLFFSALHWLGATIYGGSLVAFSLLLAMRSGIVGEHSEGVVRMFRAWGPGFGLSMGALILGGAVMHFRAHGAFVWPTDTLSQQLVAAQHLVFVALWASSFHLEIWTLAPLRKLDSPSGVSDRTAYESATQRVTRQALINSTLFLVCGALGVFAGLV